jgi:hypothetical protein
MDTRIAYCGLYCGACKIFMATAKNELEGIADITKIPVDYLECRGCRTEKINLCCMNCGIRRCCIRKEISSCSECGEFPCSVLIAFEADEHPHHHGVIGSLRELSDKGTEEWLKQQNHRWSCESCHTPFHWYEKNCTTCGREVSGYIK